MRRFASWSIALLVLAIAPFASSKPRRPPPERIEPYKPPPKVCGGTPAKWAACTAANDQQSCMRAGGQWRGLDLWGDRCWCPTGQQGCACQGQSDCLGECLVPELADHSCSQAPTGACSEFNYTAGERCVRRSPTKVKMEPGHE